MRGTFDYTLRGRLYNFEEIDYNGGEKGRVALELTLVRTRDRRVVWSALRQSEHPVEGRGVAAVVSALNAASDDVLRQTLPELARQVERDFAETHEHPQ